MAGPQSGRSRPPPPASNLLRCIIIMIISLLVIVGLIILIVWLVLRPAAIEYTVENVQIRNYNLTTDNALNATFDVSLQAHNRNRRVSIYYDLIDVTVWYSDQMVAFSDIAPFHQPKRNVTVLDVRPVAKAVPLMGTVAGKLKHDRSAGMAELEVQVKARIRFKAGAVKSRHYVLKVHCSPVVVHFGSSKPFERTYCDVDL